MLRRTSKKVKEAVDKMRLPAVVRLSRSFWDDARNGTKEAKLEFVLRQLAAMTARYLITTLELPECKMKGQDAERLAGVLAQCPALAHLDLSGNYGFRAPGQRGLQESWGRAGSWCTSISATIIKALPLRQNWIKASGAKSLAGVLAQCTGLAHLDLSINNIGAVGGLRLGASWRGEAAGLLLFEDSAEEEEEDEDEDEEEEEEEEV
jgi:hypothetical protein